MKILHKERVNGRMPISDPYILGVHHYDLYPNGNGNMGPDASLEGRNIGSDFDPDADWRMYHGEKIPGFPYHPHRGFEIVTILPEGYADHFDSKGSKGRYGQGDVQIMSAGKGVLHSEMFPLIYDDKPNPLRLFQIWVNLPSKNKLTPPNYKMIWSETMPQKTNQDVNGNTINIKVILGNYLDVKSKNALPYSWASNPDNHMGIALVKLAPGAIFKLNPVSETMKRYVLFYNGKDALLVESETIFENDFLELSGNEEINFVNKNNEAEFLILEGEPIKEPVAAYGPFVMNTQRELQEAFAEYQETQFGGWPWGEGESNLVNPKNTERFASYNFDETIDKP